MTPISAVTNGINLIDKIGWDAWFQIVVWPLAVCDAGRMMSDLKREIQKTGGSRQRGEGVKLLTRIHKRHHEQLEANSKRVKASLYGWEI